MITLQGGHVVYGLCNHQKNAQITLHGPLLSAAFYCLPNMCLLIFQAEFTSTCNAMRYYCIKNSTIKMQGL